MAALGVRRLYQSYFDTHPKTTLAVTGGVLQAVGDVVAQASQIVGLPRVILLSI